jgi:hypothetical protein
MVVVVNPTLVKNQIDVEIGTGTITEAIYPTYMYYDFGYFGQIYTAAEVGVSQPVTISAIRFNMNGDASVDKSCNNQTLKLGQVNQDQFDINIQNNFTQVPLQPVPWLSSNIQTVKNNFTWTVLEDTNDWVEIQLDTPYLYDPTITNSNLLVIWENRDGSYLTGATTPSSECSSSGVLFRSYRDFQDNSMPASTAYGDRDSTGRPNIQLILNV